LRFGSTGRRKRSNTFHPVDRWGLAKRLKAYKERDSHLKWREIAESIGISVDLISALVHGGSATQETCQKIVDWLKINEEKEE
jgi:hypothetical protein